MQNEENHRMELIRPFKKKRGKSDPAESPRQDIRHLLRLSLSDVVTAGTMAEDSRLPECLCAFAREITRVDDGAPFRPGLRRLIKLWLEDEGSAKEWHAYLERNINGVDPYLRSFLYPLVRTILRAKGSKPTKEAVNAKLPCHYH